MEQQSSRTARGVAFFRALESRLPPSERLFVDSQAASFVGYGFRAALALCALKSLARLIRAGMERRMPGVAASVAARTRYVDDALRAALSDGIGQVVLLGAGFDARAYRIEGIETARVFEVDHPLTQSAKLRALRTVPKHVALVPIDFERERLDDVLSGAGFKIQERAFFVWEGVSHYLNDRAVDATLKFVSRMQAGSRIAFTFLHVEVVETPERTPEGRYAASVGEPFKFGLKPAYVARFLTERGLELVEVLGANEFAERYFEPRGRRCRATAWDHVALARVPGDLR